MKKISVKKISVKTVFIIMMSILAVYSLVTIGFSRMKITDDENKRAQELIDRELEAVKVEKEQNKQLIEARRREAEEKKRLEAEQAEMKEKQQKKELATYYVQPGGATIYDLNKVAIGQINGKEKIFIKDMKKDASGQLSSVGFVRQYETETIEGYLNSGDVTQNKLDWIENPVMDALYTAYEPKQMILDDKHTKETDQEREPVRGVFVTGNTASGSRMDEIIALIDETELNAVVIDVKDDNGYLLFHSKSAETYNPTANEHVYMEDVKPLIEKLKAHNVYIIARIVTFKSPLYAKAHPERAIVYKDSQALYSDADGLIWASPFDLSLWEYNIGVAKEAAKLGFDEIQFDYVRFPAIANKNAMDYRNKSGLSHTAAIQKFLMKAYETLHSEGVVVSADVFGWVATAKDDVGIGQHWEALSNVVDTMCPMMYPSHYGANNFGLSVPDAYPYETIDRSIKDAIDRDKNLYTPATLRPWIQDFTASWVKGHIRYGAKEVKAQIDALRANGVNEYLVWNAGNYYSKEAFK